MKEKDNSVVSISTLKYEKYEIKKSLNSLICRGTRKIQEEETNCCSKLQVFKDMIKLGESLYNHLPDIKLSSEIDKFIDNNKLDDDSLKTSFIEDFPNEFFEDLSSKVYNSIEAKEDLINWLNIYGLPNVDSSVYLSYDYNIERINSNFTEVMSLLNEVNNRNLHNVKVSSNNTTSELDKELEVFKPLDKESIEILCKYQENDIDYTVKLLNSCSCDILSLVNCSLMFYFIFTLQNMIGQVKFKFIDKIIKPFPYLTKKYNELCACKITIKEVDDNNIIKTKNGFFYEYDFGIIINNYIKKLIKILSIYIPQVVESRDTFTTTYNELDLIMEKEDISDRKGEGTLPNLFQIDYQMRSPILTTFEYLLQILPLKNFKSSIYYCENCNEIMFSNEILCIGCKLSIGTEYINFYTKKGNIEKVSCIEEEISSINKIGIVHTPTIIKLFRNQRDQKNNYRKNKKIKNK